MTTVSRLGPLLALAKQHFEELSRLAPIEGFPRKQFGSESARPRVSELLWELTSAISALEQHFSDQLADSDSPPIVMVSSGHLAFYKGTLEPNISTIREAHWELTGLNELFGDLPPASARERNEVANAFSWGLERWLTMLDEREKEDWLDRGFDIDKAFSMSQEPIFRPDNWLENRGLLRPVLLDKTPSKLRDHVRVRLTEIYQAFTFGLWMATVALCRSVVEYSIQDNASKFGIEPKRDNVRGFNDKKRLSELAAEVAVKLPHLAASLEVVREAGNRVLHPKQREVIALPRILRDEALKCVIATRVVVETLYVT